MRLMRQGQNVRLLYTERILGMWVRWEELFFEKWVRQPDSAAGQRCTRSLALVIMLEL
jgi:hypothetical protein